MVLIDTSAWIHALRPDGDPKIRARVAALLGSGEAAICPMVRLELWNGARGAHEKRVLRDLERDIPDLGISDQVWKTAFRLAQSTRESGQTIPATDLLIAACAQHHGAGFLHDENHFKAIPQLAGT